MKMKLLSVVMVIGICMTLFSLGAFANEASVEILAEVLAATEEAAAVLETDISQETLSEDAEILLADGRGIDETNFPDAVFRAYIKETCDTDENGALSDEEIAAVTDMNISSLGIADLTGIRLFISLQTLDCSRNMLTALDVSGLTELRSLDCSVNSKTGEGEEDVYTLTALNVSGCTALEELVCMGNAITSLDVSDCAGLKVLNCNYNRLTVLDMSKNTALTSLSCTGNRLASLDVSGCVCLVELSCGLNELTALDVSHLSALETLNCTSMELDSLDLTGCVSLKELQCHGNGLAALDVSDCAALTHLYASNNALVELDVSGSGNMSLLYCDGNDLVSLKLSETLRDAVTSGETTYHENLGVVVYKLDSVSVRTDMDIQMDVPVDAENFPDDAFRAHVAENIDTDADGWLSMSERSNTTNLSVSSLGISDLTGLDHFVNLAYLDCRNNALTELKLHALTKLEQIRCSGNALTELDVSACPKLWLLSCFDNDLAALDVSACPEMIYLDCRDIPAESLVLTDTLQEALDNGVVKEYDGFLRYKLESEDGQSVTIVTAGTLAPVPSATPAPTEKPDPAPDTSEKAPATGDESPVFLCLGAAILCLAGSALGFRRKQKN